jgi:hypothetical protein
VPLLSFLLYFARCKALAHGRLEREALFDLPEGDLALMTGALFSSRAVF